LRKIKDVTVQMMQAPSRGTQLVAHRLPITFVNRRARLLLEHDPEKWEPVFGKDHAQTRSWTMILIQLDRIMV
jgi:hypothetical protein